MKRTSLFTLSQAPVIAGVTVAGWLAVGAGFSSHASDPQSLRRQALELLSPIPDRMPGAENDTAAMVKLGKELYFEKELSENKRQSCNSCHRVDARLGGVDNEATSPGAFGQRGDRNSPTTLNAGFQFAQFWDGRAEDLVAQAKGPVLNPVEMAMPSADVVVKRLREMPH
jgi:cytochrome c peroxidase